jgi:hypothetical protein
VTSRKSRKVKGQKSEIFPEVKIFLDGLEVIIITEGFSKKGIQVINDIILSPKRVGGPTW